jgi:4-amino-4-deoxy-L-arabinose transferase-like glycosyltransferase
VALALFLRVWRIRQGLPDFLDEAIPFRRALRMWDPLTGAVDWNPHLFHYPSLTFYLHLAVQKLHYAAGAAAGLFHGAPDYLLAFETDPTPHALLARLLCVGFDVATVWCVGRIGRRLGPGVGPLAALLVASSPTMIPTARAIYTDTFLAAFAVAAVAVMLAWREWGGGARLAAAGVLVGLAAGSKYPGALLLAPLALVVAERDRWRALRSWMWCAAVAAATGLATTPFALLDLPTFRRDFGFVSAMVAEGHLGNLGRAGFLFQLRHLTRDLGWPGVALLGAAPALLLAARLAAARRAGARGDVGGGDRQVAGWVHLPGTARTRLVLWACLLVFGVPVALAHIEVERYLVPVLPFAALLAADAALSVAGLVAARARPAARVALAALLTLPSLAAGFGSAALDADATRVEARRWIERHLTTRELILQETYGAPLLERMTAVAVRTGRVFRSASPEAQRAYAARHWMSAVQLPLAVTGRVTNKITGPDGATAEIQVVPHAVDLNPPFYDPRLLAGVDVMVTSSMVRGRFEQEPARYPAPNRLYALLDSTAEVAARFEHHGSTSGPTIVIYRLTPRTRRAVEALGPLPPLWWAEGIPAAYREAAERMLAPADRRHPDRLEDSAGEPTAWVASLAPLFRERFRPFAQWMAMELIERGAYDPARRLAYGIVLMAPGNVTATLTCAAACERMGAWSDARAVIERALRLMSGAGPPPGALRLEHATVLAALGEFDAARVELDALRSGPDAAVAAEASRRLEGLKRRSDSATVPVR